MKCGQSAGKTEILISESSETIRKTLGFPSDDIVRSLWRHRANTKRVQKNLFDKQKKQKRRQKSYVFALPLEKNGPKVAKFLVW